MKRPPLRRDRKLATFVLILFCRLSVFEAHLTRYIAFLRAINVGKGRVVKMETLRRAFESLGLSNVEAISLTRRRIRRWPKCTPSKLPMESALGPKSEGTSARL